MKEDILCFGPVPLTIAKTHAMDTPGNTALPPALQICHRMCKCVEPIPHLAACVHLLCFSVSIL